VSALPNQGDQHPPPLSPEALAWRRKYEDAIADGSFRDMPSASEQFEAVRRERRLPKS